MKVNSFETFALIFCPHVVINCCSKHSFIRYFMLHYPFIIRIYDIKRWTTGAFNQNIFLETIQIFATWINLMLIKFLQIRLYYRVELISKKVSLQPKATCSLASMNCPFSVSSSKCCNCSVFSWFRKTDNKTLNITNQVSIAQVFWNWYSLRWKIILPPK